MLTFAEWLLEEERREFVPQSVLNGYEYAFRQELQSLIRKTKDPVLQAKFQEMMDCPIKTARGCRSFSDYIMGAMIRNRIHDIYDVQACLSYVFQKLMMPVTDNGEPRATVFSGFDETRPYNADQNPLQGRFMKFLQFAINNIKKGKIPRLSTVERRPSGSVSIGQGRNQSGDFQGTISPDQIAARPSSDAPFAELVQDITDLLKKKEMVYGLPLSGLFAAMIAGTNSEQQRKQFGDRIARAARPVIVRLIKDYAQSSGNYRLMALVNRFQDFHGNQSAPPSRKPQKKAKPVLDHKQKDYESLMQVFDRFQGQPVSTATLGSLRRRWYDYKSRTPGSTLNRLDDTLRQMVADGVLRTIKGAQGGLLYLPGPAFEKYRQPVEA